MHSNAPQAFTRLGLILPAIEQCEAFAAEFALNEMEHDLLFDNSKFLPDGQTLSSLLPERQYARMRRALLKYLHFDVQHFGPLLPMLVAQIADEQFLREDDTVDKPALDLYLWQYAQSLNKQLLGIETREEQMNVLKAIPMRLQLQDLLHLSRNFKARRRNLLAAVALYEKGDYQQLYRSARRSSGGLRKLLLYNRNTIMAARIAQMARQQPTFFAVGAAHLGGAYGILRLLKHANCRLDACSNG